MPATRLFISYARIDLQKIVEIVPILRSGGFDPWWDDRIEPGDVFKEVLAERIDASDGIVYMLSPDSVESEWCRWEMDQAYIRKKTLIPILIRKGTKIPDEIGGMHYLDLSEGISLNDVAKLVGKLARIQQSCPLMGSVKEPRGLPSRVIRPLPIEYKTLGQAYFQPLQNSMKMFDWMEDNTIFDYQTPIIGIDFGTTNSSVAVWRNCSSQLIPNEIGEVSTPSAVAIACDGTPVVGEDAIEVIRSRPDRGVLEVKRLLRVNPKDHSDQEVIIIDDIAYTTIHFAAFVIRKLKKDAELFLGVRCSNVVLSAPAYFDEAQLLALKKAAELAGLFVRRIVPEPVAACMGMADTLKENQNWIVYDLGGGTFDASALECDDGIVEVITINGNTNLGGADFDRALVDYCVNEFRKSTGLNLAGNLPALMRIRASVERAKIALSDLKEVKVRVPHVISTSEVCLDLCVELSRSRCSELTQNLVDGTLSILDETIYASGKSSHEFHLLIVGRAARAAGVSVPLKDRFDDRLVYAPDQVVALGVAVQAGVLSGQVKGVLLLSGIANTIRVEIEQGSTTPLLLKDACIPAKASILLVPQNEKSNSSKIRIMAGESSWSARNLLLCEMTAPNYIDGFPTWPWIVILDIDANSTMHISVRGKNSEVICKNELYYFSAGMLSNSGEYLSDGPEDGVQMGNPVEQPTIPGDLCSNIREIRLWIWEIAANITSVKSYDDPRDNWGLSLKKWMKDNPGQDVPDIFSEKYWVPIDLIVDALERLCRLDLSSVRRSKSVEEIANKSFALFSAVR